jgi:hypothetical protein
MAYIGQTWHPTVTEIKENHQQIQLHHPETAVAEYSTNLGHHKQYHITSILAKKSKHMEHIVREARANELHPDNRMGRRLLPEQVMKASHSN